MKSGFSLGNFFRNVIHSLSPGTLAGSIIIPIVLVTIVAGSATVVVSTDRLSKTAAQNAEVRLDGVATQAAEQIGSLLARSLGDAVFLSQNPIIKSEEATSYDKLIEMKKMQSLFGTFQYIALVNTDGNEIISTDSSYHGDWPSNELFVGARKGVPSMSDTQSLVTPHSINIQIASPVVDSTSAIRSVLIANLNMEYIWQIIDRVKVGDTGYVCLIDKSGEIIAGPDKARLFTKIVFLDDGEEMPPKHELIEYTEEGRKMCAVIAAVNLRIPWAGNEWNFVGIMPASEAFATANDAARLFWIAIGILLVLFTFVGLILGRNLSGKISALVKGTTEIAQGNLNHRLPPMQPSELGQLTESFNTMSEKLQASNAEIAQWNAHLEDEVEAKTKELDRIMAGKVQSERLSAMGYIAASAAHELNDPLTAISGYSQLGVKELEREHTPEDSVVSMNNASQYFKQIAKELQRSKNIIRKLLSFVRYSKTADENMDVNQVISDTLSIASHHLELNKVQLATNLQPDLRLIVGNVQKLQQVFLNMILSAQRTMPQGGKLVVNTNYDSEENRIKIIFSDTGGGISPENLDKIFEPLPTAINNGQETRIDLSVSQDIIQQLGGEIKIRSKMGIGTTYVISLPCTAAGSAQDSLNTAEKHYNHV